MDTAHRPVNKTLVNVFVTLNTCGSGIFALMVLSALLFRNVKRPRVWYNFCVSWIVFGVSYSLLTFGGQQYRRQPQPVTRTCLAQAAMVYAAPFPAAIACLGLVGQLLLNIISVTYQDWLEKSYSWLKVLSIVLSWTAWGTVLAIGLLFGIRNPTHVRISFNGTYCVLEFRTISRITSVSTAIFAFGILSIEVFIWVLLYRSRATRGALKQSISMAFRILLFTIAAVTAAIVGIVYASTPYHDAGFDLIIGSVPVATAIIFGTQMDLWRGYITCGFRSRSTAPTTATMSIPWNETVSMGQSYSYSSPLYPSPRAQRPVSEDGIAFKAQV